MTLKENEALLTEIRDLLKAQQATLEEIKSQRPAAVVTVKRHHLRNMLILAAIVLASGSYGAYQYYLVLQSIINQFPGHH